MTTGPPETLEQLVARAQLGDSEAFGGLVERCTPLLLGFLYGQLKSREDCEDVAQQTFVEAFRGLRRLKTPATFSPWLLKLATHNLIDYKRRQAAQRRGGSLEIVPLQEGALAVPDPDPRPDAALSSKEAHALVLLELEQLDEQKRQVVYLRLVAELSIPEIAAALGIREEAVRMRLSRGVRILRQRLMEARLPQEDRKNAER